MNYTTKIQQAKILWNDRGYQETAMMAQTKKFEDFWDQDWKNLTNAQQQTILDHYIQVGDIQEVNIIE